MPILPWLTLICCTLGAAERGAFKLSLPAGWGMNVAGLALLTAGAATKVGLAWEPVVDTWMTMGVACGDCWTEIPCGAMGLWVMACFWGEAGMFTVVKTWPVAVWWPGMDATIRTGVWPANNMKIFINIYESTNEWKSK